MNSLKIRKFITYDIILNFDNKISPELQIFNSVNGLGTPDRIIQTTE